MEIIVVIILIIIWVCYLLNKMDDTIDDLNKFK
jgi:hypothetical protein